MKSRELGCVALVLLALVANWFLPGCSDPTEPQPDPADIVNPDKPTGNDRIVSQAVIGDAAKWSTLWAIKKGQGDGYCFRGGYNSYYGVGRLNGAGEVSWFYRTGFTPNEIHVLSPSSAVPNALVAVGSKDADGDGRSDIGYVSLVSSSGSLLNQLVYSADTSDVALNALVPISDSLFVIAGGIATGAVTHPLIASLVVTSAGQLEKRDQLIVTDLSQCWFSHVEVEPSVPAGPDWSFFASSHSETNTYAVHKITVTWPSLTGWTIDWSRDLVVDGVLAPWVNDLRLVGGNLYWVGGADDPTKEPRPSSGGYWNSAVAGSIALSGQPRWAKVVRTTGHSELYSDVLVDAGSLYGVGSCAKFVRQDQYFGYGWICRMATETGEVESNTTMGDHSYASGFAGALLEGSAMRCVGWTHQEVSGVYRGWLCNVDISTTFAGRRSAVPAPMDVGDRTIPGDQEAGAGSDR